MSTRLMFRFSSLLAMAAAFAAAPLAAVEITEDTRIDATNVGTYQSVPLAVAAGATLTIDLAPTAEQVFSGAVSGAGRIVVANTGTRPIRFSGSFQAFTGALSATGAVQVGGIWQSVALNGTLSGVTVLGAADKTITFYGPNVFGTGGGGTLNPGHGSTPRSTLDFKGFDQTVANLLLNGCPYKLGDDGCKTPTYVLTSATPATLTLAGTIGWVDRKTLHHNEVVKVNGQLSLVFDGEPNTSFTFHGASATAGGLTVKAGEVVVAADASFNSLSSLTAAGTGRIVLETAAVNAVNLTLAIADSGSVALPAGEAFPVGILKVDGASLPPGLYSAEEIATRTGGRLSGAAVEVLSREIGETATFTWTGGGADDRLTTAANWAGGVAPSLTGGDEILVFAAGTSATLPGDVDVYGLSFATTGDFVLKGASAARLLLGAGGVTCAAAADGASRTVTFAVAPQVAGAQTWTVPATAVVDLSAGWTGRSAVTLERPEGTGDILRFSSDETPGFAGNLSVTNGSILVLSGRGGLGAAGAHVRLNGRAGLRTTAVCVTNHAALTFAHGPALKVAPAGTAFVQLGAVTNVSGGAESSQIPVGGTLRLLGGLGEAASHLANPAAYWAWPCWFAFANDSATLWIGENPVSVGDRPFLLFGGKMHLAATGCAWGVLTLLHDVRVICDGANVLAAGGDLGFYPIWPGAVDLNGHDQTARDALTVSEYGVVQEKPGYAAMFVTSATPATLTLTGAATVGTTHNLNFQGAASLHYAGTGRLALTNTASTTTGSLTVSSGEVALLAGATWGACTNVVVSGSGRLTLDAAVAAGGAFAREATVRVDGDGTLAIPAGETVTVKYLYRNGEGQFSGLYRDGFVTGGGTLRVRRAARPTGALFIIR